MEWLNGLRDKVVAIDTAPFIYLIERHPRYLPVVQPLFHRLDQGEFVAVTSSLTLLEVLVLPIRNHNIDLAVKYREILAGARNLSILPVNTVVAESAAGLRAIHGLKTPDAIQFATAGLSGAQVLITNDAALKSIPGVAVLILDQVLSTA